MSDRMDVSRTRGLLTLVAVAAAVAWAPGVAAQEADSRWLPWLGCWTRVEAPAEAPMTCVVPGDAGGVVMHTVTSEGVQSSRTLAADGVARPVEESGCRGSEEAAFSADGRRVFLRTSLSCDGDVERETRGLIAMVGDDQWIEVDALAVDGRSVAWVHRYRAAAPYRIKAAGMEGLAASLAAQARAVETARRIASAPVSVDAIIEATTSTDPEAVRTWLTEQGAPIELDAARLVRMADAGVPAEVIDVAVAVSYPDRFQVARESDERPANVYGTIDPWGYRSPYFYDPYYGYGYSRFSRYGYWGYRYGWSTPGVVIVRPVDGGSSQGRMVKGRGYTRGGGSDSSVRPSRPSTASQPASTSTGSSRTTKGKAKPRGGG